MAADAAPTFDLQSHSHHSDGALAPAEVVRAAAAAGVQLLALTDHDSIAGVAEAQAEGRRAGIKVLAAAEISALHEDHEDLHILGYGLNPEHPGLQRALADYRADRESRARRMTQALREAGLAVDEAALDRQAAGGGAVGRPHLARAVHGHPANAERLAREGLETPEAVLQAYLLPGQPGYRGRTRPTVAQAIEVIHAAGGAAVWAHPFWDVKDASAVGEAIAGFAAWGLDGVEAFYVTHDEAQTRAAVEAAAAHGLLTTGSSDFHGPRHRLFSRFRAHRLYGLEPRLGPLADG